MLLLLPEFDLHAADSVAEASDMLSRYGGDARILAGGTDLFILMKHKRLLPRHLVNIKRIPGLDQIERAGRGGLRIGALATAQDIAASRDVGGPVAALRQAAGLLGTAQVRNLATIGGNLGNASPSAEFAPPLLTLDASVRCVGGDGERDIPIDRFFLAPGKCDLGADEVLTEIRVPDLPKRGQSHYVKHSLRRMDVSMAAASVYVELDGEVCREVRIALGAVAPTPFRALRAEAVMRGERLAGGRADAELLEQAARTAAGESSPIDDIRGYAGYRREIVATLVRQGLEQTVARARNGMRRAAR